MATEKDHYWQFYLRANTLTKDNLDDCVAEVFTAPKTMRNEDIVRAIMEDIVRGIMQEGSEVSNKTTLSIVNKRDSIIPENRQDEHSIISEIRHSMPRATGVSPSFGAPNIDLVTDTLTDQTDGSITPGEDIRIDGNRVKIAGLEGEATNGVFFVPASGTPIPVTRRLVRNDPNCLIACVPPLAAGDYTLRLVTRFSQSNTLLKRSRIIEYKKPLTVARGGSERLKIV